MDDRLDAQLSLGAVVLVVFLIAGQVILLAAHLWVPMAQTANLLLEDEPDLYGTGADDATSTDEADADRGPRLSPWRWAAYATSALALGLGVFAVRRLLGNTGERVRWTWVLLLSAFAALFGLFSAWVVVRQALMLGQLTG